MTTDKGHYIQAAYRTKSSAVQALYNWCNEGQTTLSESAVEHYRTNRDDKHPWKIVDLY